MLGDKIAKECSESRHQITCNKHTEHEPTETAQQEDTSGNEALCELGRTSAKVADELGSLLDGLTIEDNPHMRKRDIIQNTIKVMWKQSDVDRLTKELTRLQNDLSIHQCSLIRSVSTKLSTIEPLTNSYSERLEELRIEMRSLKQSNLDRYECSCHEFRGLRDNVEKFIHPVIQSLIYPEIHLRFDKIPRAYIWTFEWLFTPTATAFPEWLKSGDGIFWMSGKAGSGKSTLMKFLSSHQNT